MVAILTQKDLPNTKMNQDAVKTTQEVVFMREDWETNFETTFKLAFLQECAKYTNLTMPDQLILNIPRTKQEIFAGSGIIGPLQVGKLGLRINETWAKEIRKGEQANGNIYLGGKNGIIKCRDKLVLEYKLGFMFVSKIEASMPVAAPTQAVGVAAASGAAAAAKK